MWYGEKTQVIDGDIAFGQGRWMVRTAETPSGRSVAVAAPCEDGSGSLYVSFEPVSVCLICSPHQGRSPPLVLDRAVYTTGAPGTWDRDVGNDIELEVWTSPVELSRTGAKVAYSWAGESATRFIDELIEAASGEYMGARIGMLRRFGHAIGDQSWFTFIRLDGILEVRQAALARATVAYAIAETDKLPTK